MYDSERNFSDVRVITEKQKMESNIVNIEVNSSPIRYTVAKSILGLIQLARIAHKDVDVLTGFSLPKLQSKAVAVRTEIRYVSENGI